MRADRLLSALMLLQSRGQMSGRELAENLEVSERTIHRDMEALSAAGVPIFAVRGSKGGWQLEENWRTQVPGLEETELRALLMAQPRSIGDARLAAAAERALNKLMASLPVSMRERATAIRQRLYVDTAGWRGPTENLAMLPIVQDAVSKDRKISFRYHKVKGEPEDRIADPLGLVSKGVAWYLAAQTPRGLRTYRVSRMEEVKLLDRPSERPAGFDLAAYWKSSTDELKGGWARYETVLRLDPSAAREVKRWISPVSSDDERPDREGWVTFRVPFETEGHARFVILGLGPTVDVLEPQALREQIAKDVLATARRLRSTTGQAGRKRRSPDRTS